VSAIRGATPVKPAF